MAAKADDDDATMIHPVEAVVFCLMQCNEIYTANFFETEGAEAKLREMGKTIRAYSKCLSEIGMYYEPSAANGEAMFDDDDEE